MFFHQKRIPNQMQHTDAMDHHMAPAVQAAVDRALAKQKADATREVEAILDAALRVAEKCVPAPPRVADIVAEAGTSNQTFYRYFAGKDDLMHAVYERGMARVHSYLAHRMEKETDPRRQIAAWIHGVLLQVTDATAARQSAALHQQLNGGRKRSAAGSETLTGVGDLLLDPVCRAGSQAPELDVRVVEQAVFGAMKRHFTRGAALDREETDHLVAFCLRGLTTDGAHGR